MTEIIDFAAIITLQYFIKIDRPTLIGHFNIDRPAIYIRINMQRCPRSHIYGRLHILALQRAEVATA